VEDALRTATSFWSRAGPNEAEKVAVRWCWSRKVIMPFGPPGTLRFPGDGVVRLIRLAPAALRLASRLPMDRPKPLAREWHNCDSRRVLGQARRHFEVPRGPGCPGSSRPWWSWGSSPSHGPWRCPGPRWCRRMVDVVDLAHHGHDASSAGGRSAARDVVVPGLALGVRRFRLMSEIGCRRGAVDLQVDHQLPPWAMATALTAGNSAEACESPISATGRSHVGYRRRTCPGGGTVVASQPRQ